MEVFDRLNKLIEIGSYVRYDETGTIGKVSDIKKELSLKGDEKDSHSLDDTESAWIQIEKTELWFLSDVLEVIDKSDVKLSKFEQSQEEENENNYNDDMVEELKEQAQNLEKMELTSGGGEGGG